MSLTEESSVSDSRGLGRVVRRFRRLRNLSLEGLARRAGISVTQLARIERLESSPTEEKIRALARVLQVPVSVLFEEPEVRQHPDVVRTVDRLEVLSNQLLNISVEMRGMVRSLESPEKRDGRRLLAARQTAKRVRERQEVDRLVIAERLASELGVRSGESGQG